MRESIRTASSFARKQSRSAQRGLFGLQLGGLTAVMLITLSFTATTGSSLEVSTGRSGHDRLTNADSQSTSGAPEKNSTKAAAPDLASSSAGKSDEVTSTERDHLAPGLPATVPSAAQTEAPGAGSPGLTSRTGAQPSATYPSTTRPVPPSKAQPVPTTANPTEAPTTRGRPPTADAPSTTQTPSATTSAAKPDPTAPASTAPISTVPASTVPTSTVPAAVGPTGSGASPATVLLSSSPVSNVGFGSMTNNDITNMFGITPDWLTHGDTLAVVDGAIRHRYVPGSTGTAPVSFAIPLADTDSATMRYQVKFESGWEWIHGGKLPGLAGGSMPSGGKGRNDGFSSRFMWRADGELVVYNYRPGIPGPWGEDIHVMAPLPIDQWVEIEQTISMNDVGSSNGVLEVRVNGALVLSRTDMVWRVQADVTIDHLLYSSFYGGGDPTWAPSKTTFAQFRNFSVTTG